MTRHADERRGGSRGRGVGRERASMLSDRRRRSARSPRANDHFSSTRCARLRPGSQPGRRSPRRRVEVAITLSARVSIAMPSVANCCAPIAWRPPKIETAFPRAAARRTTSCTSRTLVTETTLSTRVGLSWECRSLSSSPRSLPINVSAGREAFDDDWRKSVLVEGAPGTRTTCVYARSK